MVLDLGYKRGGEAQVTSENTHSQQRIVYFYVLVSLGRSTYGYSRNTLFEPAKKICNFYHIYDFYTECYRDSSIYAKKA